MTHSETLTLSINYFFAILKYHSKAQTYFCKIKIDLNLLNIKNFKMEHSCKISIMNNK